MKADEEFPRLINTGRVKCQGCGRMLVPKKDGTARRHNINRNISFARCPGSGYRLRRWNVGDVLVHHTGCRWRVADDIGGRYDDYLIQLIENPYKANERPLGSTLTTNGEYMHRHGWELETT